MSSLAFVVDTQLQRITCYSCAVEFGLSGTLYKQRRNDHGIFYCPNGHGQHFTGKTETQELRAELEAEKRRRAMIENDRDNERERRHTAETGKAVVSGMLQAERKRSKARARAGVCPLGCRRHFVNLERHVASKHGR